MTDDPFNPNEQDANLQDFVAILGKEDAYKLHMFFSPNRIPLGLTDQEAVICVSLYPLRKEYNKKHRKKPDGFIDFITNIAEYCKPPPSLPEALIYRGEEITRERFKEGICDFLAQVSKP